MAPAAYLTWLLLFPLIFALVAFAARWLESAAVPVALAAHLASITLVLVLSLLVVREVLAAGQVLGLGHWLHVDALGAVFVLIIGVVGFLVGLYSVGYTQRDLETGELDVARFTTYYGLLSLFLFTMLLVATANNIIMMWVAVEATTLGSAFLVGIYQQRASLEAAWKYVIICTVGVAFGLYGTILIYSDAVSFTQAPGTAVLWTEIIQYAASFDPTLVKMAFVFVLVGFGTKAGLFPMHAWLPDAHSEAPSPVSALLSGVLLNCALLVIFRFATIANLALGPAFTQTLFVVFGTLSVAAAAFFMYVQRDLKRLLAYSSMENIGLVVLAFGLGGPVGVAAGLLQAINHSLVKALMFCATGNVLLKYHSRSLDQVRGLARVLPATGALLMAGGLALVGLPPFNVFLSKFLIVTAGTGAGYAWLMVVCLLLLTVAFAAIFRVLAATLLGVQPEGVRAGEINWLTLAPAVGLVALSLALGVWLPEPLVQLLNGAGGALGVGGAGGLAAFWPAGGLWLPLVSGLP